MTTAQQPSLLDLMARRTDPDTSWDAAADALVSADTNRALALKELRRHPDGLTDFELAELTGIQQTSIGKRRGELRDQGLVEYAGIKRAAPSGSMSRVWRAVNVSDTRVLTGRSNSPLPSAVTNSRGESEERPGLLMD